MRTAAVFAQDFSGRSRRFDAEKALYSIALTVPPRPRVTRKPPMTYAQGRIFNDADSHIMELPDFLKSHADPAMRDRVPTIPVPTVGALAVLDPESARTGRHSPAK